MLVDPHEIARRIGDKHRPWWLIWYGDHTRQFWAMPSWVRTPHAILSATTPDGLDAAIAVFESLHPRPGRQR
jgi:hypothetical protein